MEISDATLVEQCLGGRKDAFAGLVRRYQDAVYNLAYRWTGDRDAAADLAQETFIRAYRNLGSFRADRSFRNWVLAICANLARNRFRSEKRRQRAQEAHAELYGPVEPAPLGDSTLDHALTRIPEKLRVPLVLKHVEGLSYEEVAGVLGIGVSAAKMRVKRARDQLVVLLEGTPP